MRDAKRFTSKEVRQLFEEATAPERDGRSERARSERSEGSESTLSLDEVQAAARDAGISESQLDRAIRRLEGRRSRPLTVVVFVACALIVTLGLLLWSPAGLAGWRGHALLLHNEHRHHTYVVELLRATDGEPLDCRQPPPLRASRDRYERWRQIDLPPRGRLEVELPARARSPGSARCQSIWVRIWESGRLVDSALFELPVGVEIQRDGHLDQRGLGRHRMHPPPAYGETDSRQP